MKVFAWWRRERVDAVAVARLPLRAGVASALALAIAFTFSLGSPIYALVSAVVVTDLHPAQTRKLAVPRVFGTCIGAAIGCIATLLMRPDIVSATIGVVLPMYLCNLLRIPDAARVSGYVSGIIILGFSYDPWTHAGERLLETVVGIAAAAAVSMVPLGYRPEEKKKES